MTEGERERLEGDMRGLVCMVTRKKMVPERWPRLSVEDKIGEVRLRTSLAEDRARKVRIPSRSGWFEVQTQGVTTYNCSLPLEHLWKNVKHGAHHGGQT